MAQSIDLLDPGATDRYLRAYALLASEYESGTRSAIECLLPFCIKAVQAHAGNAYDVESIREYINNTYRIRIPLYMLEGFTHQLELQGVIQKDSNTGLHICSSDTPNVDPKLDLNPGQLSNLEEELARYAQSRGLPSPLASSSWSEAFISAFADDPQSDAKRAIKFKDQIITDPKHVDDALVSYFLGDLQRNESPLYEIAKKLYFGIVIADFFVCFNETSQHQDLEGLQVVLDATVMLRLLGTSGTLFQTATTELVDDLLSLKSRLYYFPHIYEELIGNLTAAINGLTYGSTIFHETREALATGELPSSALRMLPNVADSKLGQHNIFQHPANYQNTRDSFQIDEERFAHELGGTEYRKYMDRFQNDAQSFALIMRLRGTAKAKTLRDARAVLVTHNRRLARKAKEYFRSTLKRPADEIPPILTLNQISAFAWLTRGGSLSDEKLTREFAASCYKARLPKDGWDETFLEQLQALKDNSEECRELLKDQFVVGSVRNVVLDDTFGVPVLARQIDFEEIVRRADARKEELAAHASQEGKTKGQQEESSRIEKKIEGRAHALVATTTRSLFTIAGVALCGLFAWYSYKEITGISEPAMIAGYVSGVALSLGSLFDSFRPGGWLRALREQIERKQSAALAAWLKRLIL